MGHPLKGGTFDGAVMVVGSEEGAHGREEAQARRLGKQSHLQADHHPRTWEGHALGADASPALDRGTPREECPAQAGAHRAHRASSAPAASVEGPLGGSRGVHPRCLRGRPGVHPDALKTSFRGVFSTRSS